MLAEEDDLARRARDDLFDLGLCRAVRTLALRRPVRQLDHASLAILNDPLKPRTAAHSLVDDTNRTSFEKSGFEVVNQVCGVLDADAETDEVFGEVAGGADGRIDRGVTVPTRESASHQE